MSILYTKVAAALAIAVAHNRRHGSSQICGRACEAQTERESPDQTKLQLANELSGCHEILITCAMLGSTKSLPSALELSEPLLVVQ